MSVLYIRDQTTGKFIPIQSIKGDPGSIDNVTIASIEGLQDALDAKQDAGDYLLATGTAADSEKRGGVDASGYLTTNSTAADSAKLGGVDASEYAKRTDIPEDLGGDADTLGGKAPVYYWGGSQNYTYEGRDLSTIFESLDDLHTAVEAGDFSNIRIGDYWPITLNGTIKDYATGETKTLSNAVFKMEVAPQVYVNYSNQDIPNHLLMCSRDLLPLTCMYRSGNETWYDSTATNPWLGSHLYQTLNASDGVLPLVEDIFGAYMYAGTDEKGMQAIMETKAAGTSTATGWGWGSRGKLFLPTEREIWGQDMRSEHVFGAGTAIQWPFFCGSLRHIMKGLGDCGSRCGWWCQSSSNGTTNYMVHVSGNGLSNSNGASTTGISVPLCFLFV